MFSITRLFLFATLVTMVFADVVPYERILNLYGQQIPPPTVQRNAFYYPITPQPWPQGNQPAFFANQPIFPAKPTVYPATSTIFPEAQTIYSAAPIYSHATPTVQPVSPMIQVQQIMQGLLSPLMNQNQRPLMTQNYSSVLLPTPYNQLMAILSKSLNSNTNNNVIQSPSFSPSYNQQLQSYNQQLQPYNQQLQPNNQQPQAQVQPNLQDKLLQQHQQQAIKQNQLINDRRKMQRKTEEDIKRRVQLLKLHDKNKELENTQVKEEPDQETSEVQEYKDKEESEKKKKVEEENVRKLHEEEELLKTKQIEEAIFNKQKEEKLKHQVKKKPESIINQNRKSNPGSKTIRRGEHKHTNSKTVQTP